MKGRVVTNRDRDRLHCAAGCGQPIRLGEKMRRRSDGVFRFNEHYPTCPKPEQQRRAGA
jgi:hypothetical protein